jgi:hypothetical protein
VADNVAAYVHEVRAELADLPVEDVDDLTGGMEADLSELAAESGGDLIGRLGIPGLYAAELRSAAGLPERVSAPGRRLQPIHEVLAHARASFTILTEDRPGLRSVTEFLVTLRPAWWVLRAYLAAWAIWSFTSIGMAGFRPRGVFQPVLGLAAVVLSVQLGRGWMRQLTVTRVLLFAGNAVAVFLILLLAWSGRLTGAAEQSYEGSGSFSPVPGMSLDGQPVANVYPYDSEGKRITGVRLFDQGGRPLNAQEGEVDVSGNPLGLVRDSSGAPRLNVYPRAVAGTDPWQVTDPANLQGDPSSWTPPVAIVPLAPNATPTSGPKATPKPTPTPTDRVTSTPTATPDAKTSRRGPSTPTAPTPSSRPTRR